jgi:transketolase
MTAEIKRFHQLKQEGKSPESLIFFLGRENFPESYPELKNQKHSETLLVACGSMLPQAIKAQRILEEDGVTVEVYDHYQTIPINTQELESIFKDKKLIITVEDHQVIGGAGSILATTLGYNYKFKHLGVNGIFGRSSYKAEQLYEMAGIDALSIVKKVKEYQSNQ